jgi:hypothetical protein
MRWSFRCCSCDGEGRNLKAKWAKRRVVILARVLGFTGGIHGRRVSSWTAGQLEDEVVEFSDLCARADGVEGIESDSTLIYTGSSTNSRRFAPTAEPLSPKHWESRLVCGRFEIVCAPDRALNQVTTTKSWCHHALGVSGAGEGQAPRAGAEMGTGASGGGT